MSEYKRVEDRWKNLRQELKLFGSVEPEVTLEAITSPVKLYSGTTAIHKGSWGDDRFMDWKKIEMVPALAASTSYGSKEKIDGNYGRAVSLNKKLISMGHHVPLECIQTVWHIGGIPKSAGSQLSRHRMCGHVSASRRYQSAKPAFVYPMLDYIENKEEVERWLGVIENQYKDAYFWYNELRQSEISSAKTGEVERIKVTPLRKEDARVIIPINSASERTWWCNIRELRHIFDLRLRADTESCLRNIMWQVYDTIQPLLPSLFYDFEEEMQK